MLRKKRYTIFSLLLSFMILAGLMPLKPSLRAEGVTVENEVDLHAFDFNDYVGSETEAMAPKGFGIGNFSAGQAYAIGDSEVFGQAPNSAKLVTKIKKNVQLYKGLKKNPIRDTRQGFEALVQFSDNSHNRLIFHLNDAKSSANSPDVKPLVFRPDGKIRVLGTDVPGKTYEGNTPYSVRLLADLENHRLTVYINGELLIENAALPETWTETNYFRFTQNGKADTESSMNVDDIRIFTYTEAEATIEPTAEPSVEPTEEPTAEPTEEPTTEPTEEPTAEPTEEPTAEPTEEPTAEPTEEPTAEPTEEPTAEPTEEPTAEPTAEPTPGPEPLPAPVEDPEKEGHERIFFENFDRYAGSTEGGERKVGQMSAYNTDIDGNYIKALMIAPREDVSAGFFTNSSAKPLALAKYNLETAENLREETVYFEASVRFGEKQQRHEVFQLNDNSKKLDPSSSNKYATLFTFDEQGRILLNGKDSGKKYETGLFYELKASFNTETKALHYWLNGMEIFAEGASSLTNGFRNLSGIKFQQKNVTSDVEGRMDVDDVKLYTYLAAAPPPPPGPTPDPSDDSYTAYFEDSFDTYVGPSESSGGSVPVSKMKAFLVINGKNYVTHEVVSPREDKSLAFHTSVRNPDNKPLNVTKDEIDPPIEGKLVFEVNVMFKDIEHTREIFQLRNVKNGNVSWMTLFTFDEHGKIRLNKKATGRSYETDTWYKLGVLMDTDMGTARYFINDEEVTAVSAETLPANFASVFSLKFTQLGRDLPAGQEGIMYIDDVRVYGASHFMEKPDLEDLPVVKTVLGWEVQNFGGAPEVSEAVPPHESETGIKLVMTGSGDRPALRKTFEVEALQNYAVDTWLRVETNKKISFVTEVKPIKDGQFMQRNGRDIVFESHNNTRGAAIGSERMRVRSYFRAPAGCEAVQVRHIAQGVSETYIVSSELLKMPNWGDKIGRYSSAEISHPIGDDLKLMFLKWQAKEFENETAEEREAKLAPILAADEVSLIAQARASAESRSTLDVHPEFEAHTRRLAQKYAENPDEDLARRVILIMREFALQYHEVPRLIDKNDLFHAHGKYIPMQVLYAYDLIYNASSWEELSAELGVDVRKEVEDWFRNAFMNLYNIHNDVYYSNIAPYGIRNAMGLAVVLNDPDVIRLILPWIDTMLSGRQYHADGMWEEGTISYGMQVANNINTALELLQKCYKDPEGYVDETFGLSLDHTDLTPRWPLLARTLRLDEIFRFPNGSRVALHDTWAFGQKAGDPVYDFNSPILPQYLHNTELWHFGHYSLKQGDAEEATQVNLSFPPMSEGLPYSAGHYHGNHLGITLWGSGIEALPDSGYPKNKYRFFNMDTQGHNAAWVYDERADYNGMRSLWVRPSLLAYDPGSFSDKEVQLIEASSPGTVHESTKMKRRLLLLIRSEGNRSYVLDLQRLQGGQAHELFMHASEDEHCRLDTSLNLSEHSGTMNDYIAATGNTSGLSKWRHLLRNPRSGDGSRDFSFTWTGDDSGASLNVHMNGIENADLVFSSMPTNRRTQNVNSRMEDYPNWHFYRRKTVNSSEITRYGAVYETTRRGQEAKVKRVVWEQPELANPMCQIAKVDMGDCVDIIYISDDTSERSYEGIRFAGKTAVIRLDAEGTPIWGYVYGEGQIVKDEFEVQGEKDLVYKAVSMRGSMTGESTLSSSRSRSFEADDNVIAVDRPVTKRSLAGCWLRTEAGDGSGYGMRIEGNRGSELLVHDVPPYEILQASAKMLYFPSVHNSETGYLNQHAGDSGLFTDFEIPGEVKIEIRTPVFKRNVTEPEETTAEPTPTEAEPEETTEPEVTETEPEEMTEPAVTETESAEMTEPEVTEAKPEETTAEPSMTKSESEAEPTESKAEPSITQTAAEESTAEPGAAETEPAETKTEPSMTESESETEPTESKAEPSITQTAAEESTAEPGAAETKAAETAEPGVTETKAAETKAEPSVTESESEPELTESKAEPGLTETEAAAEPGESKTGPDLTENKSERETGESRTEAGVAETGEVNLSYALLPVLGIFILLLILQRRRKNEKE